MSVKKLQLHQAGRRRGRVTRYPVPRCVAFCVLCPSLYLSYLWAAIVFYYSLA